MKNNGEMSFILSGIARAVKGLIICTGLPVLILKKLTTHFIYFYFTYSIIKKKSAISLVFLKP